MLIILLTCIALQSIQADYYSKHSLEVANIDMSELCMAGDSLDIALNRIARANYKHGRYKYALELADRIESDYKRLVFDTDVLKALLHKNLGQYQQADSLYKILTTTENDFKGLQFEMWLNYADLKRLQRKYKLREQYLLKALSLAQPHQKNKIYRVLARHYFNVLQDFDSARQILARHATDSLSGEDKAGFALVRAQLSEAKQAYKKAQRYYSRADTLAREAGFLRFQYDAVDGAMRSAVLLREQKSKQLQLWIFNLLFAIIFSSFLAFNHYYDKTNRRA